MTKNKKNKPKDKKLSVKNLQQAIVELYKKNPTKRYSARQIIKKLEIGNSKDSVEFALQKLTETNVLAIGTEAVYGMQDPNATPNDETTLVSDEIKAPAKPKLRGDLREGIVDMTRSGSAYIVCDGLDDDIFVNGGQLNGALHGDRVQVKVIYRKNKIKPDGEVVKVLDRATDHFVGTIRVSPKYAFVVPDRANMPVDIYVDLANTKNAKNGEKVVVKIIEWHSHRSRSKNPEGVVTVILGKANTSDIEMKTILINNGFDIEFSPEVLAEANMLPTLITKDEIARRRDMRNVITFTIDPEDAKDFDDALSFRYLKNGNIEVGVHIADVSHYIHPDTALDKEAARRTTSVYLVDRVCPMLPEKLSNELCSLRPNEDKLTFSAIFEFDDKYKIVDQWFGKTIIHSNRRFSYEQAQEVLDHKKGDFVEELLKLNEIAYKLRKNRFRNGAINFETEEVRFRLDEQGVPIEVYVKERKDAHLLIEDFMLLANRQTAAFIAQKGKEAQEVPFVYRIHDSPNMEKLAEFALFAKQLGFKMDISTPKNISKSFNELAKVSQKYDVFKILQPIAIRTMAKAIYSTENIGHYGLAFDYYTHFTSPIRRYSDVLSHRILEKNLKSTYRMSKDDLEKQCKYISAQERHAMDAERESIKYKQVEFIEKHEGEIFDGIISGFLERGAFVSLKHSHCEGLASFDSSGEPFELDSSRLWARSRKSGKILRMGDSVKVRVISADLNKRQIEMQLILIPA